MKRIILETGTSLIFTSNRGGASEASGATFTDHVAGARDVTRAPVCMYVSYVRQALRPITPRACANGAESAIFEIHFYRERKLWGKKDLLLRSGLEPALQTTAFATEPMGLLQLWTANLALILLTAAVSVDYSERPWPSGISGESQQTQALQGTLLANQQPQWPFLS